MYLSYDLTEWGFPQIARALGRDHSTIHYGVKKIERLLSSDAMLAANIATIKATIEAAHDGFLKRDG